MFSVCKHFSTTIAILVHLFLFVPKAFGVRVYLWQTMSNLLSFAKRNFFGIIWREPYSNVANGYENLICACRRAAILMLSFLS